MRSTEKREDRLKRVDMHTYFLTRIDEAMKQGRYIESSWLIYSCFENRYFRTIEKIKKECMYSNGKCKKENNELALRTKVRCIQRLTKERCECFSNAFSESLFEETIKWIKERHTLMHNLLKLEKYRNMDEEFKEVSITGLKLLNETYKCCNEFRRLFYRDGYVFVFPKNAMESCPCKPHVENKTELNG